MCRRSYHQFMCQTGKARGAKASLSVDVRCCSHGVWPQLHMVNFRYIPANRPGSLEFQHFKQRPKDCIHAPVFFVSHQDPKGEDIKFVNFVTGKPQEHLKPTKGLRPRLPRPCDRLSRCRGCPFWSLWHQEEGRLPLSDWGLPAWGMLICVHPGGSQKLCTMVGLFSSLEWCHSLLA